MSTTCYILGPMTGYHDDNRPAFRKARDVLREQGFKVVCPDELDDVAPAQGARWSDFLTRDIPHLLRVDFGVALPGWRKSKGATLESMILTALGKPIVEFRMDGMHVGPLSPEQYPRIVHPTPQLI